MLVIGHRGPLGANRKSQESRPEQLDQAWRDLFESDRPRTVCGDLLIKALGYRLQEKAIGGLKPSTRRLLERWGRNARLFGIVLIATTLFMAFWAAHVPIATRFEDLFPARHPDTVLYRQFRRQYGGAQQLVLMLRVRQGDIFNFHTLQAIQDMTRAVDKLSGVNHNEVFSLASYRVLYAAPNPAHWFAPFMFPDVPHTQQQLDDLKSIVRAHRQQLADLVARDERGAVVIASFNETRFDYRALFDGVQRIIREHEDRNTRIYASGAAMFAAWGYHYLARIGMTFAVSAVPLKPVVFAKHR